MGRRNFERRVTYKRVMEPMRRRDDDILLLLFIFFTYTPLAGKISTHARHTIRSFFRLTRIVHIIHCVSINNKIKLVRHCVSS